MKSYKVTSEVCDKLEKHIIFLEKSHRYSKRFLTKRDLEFLDMQVLKYKARLPSKNFTKKETKKILKSFVLDVLKRKLEFYRNIVNSNAKK